MDINRLKAFRAIVESGSMRRAAELLHRTPGALSKAVAQLEEELGRELFVPSGRGIAVTDEGMRLYDASEPVVRAFE
ncbi:MAG: LysR family transcriptional regulator, partial [SAR324 cluster bacterium]|nr:LysR family transcriptional regulator [SAR324 cluster bacterium]